MPIAVMMESSGEHHIDDDDLRDHQKNAAGAAPALATGFAALQPRREFRGLLRDQEQPAADQDDVAPRTMAGPRTVMTASVRPIEPHKQAEQENAEQAKRQRHPICRACLACGSGMREHLHRQKDDVVDAGARFPARSASTAGAHASGLVKYSIMLERIAAAGSLKIGSPPHKRDQAQRDCHRAPTSKSSSKV